MPLLGAMCHVGITVSDLNGAMEFFKPFLEFLGYEIWDEIQNPYEQRVRSGGQPWKRRGVESLGSKA